MNGPEISVVLPTYNRSDVLPRALRSIEAQTYENLEIIIVDGGSTDGTLEFLDGLDTDITLVNQENRNGAAVARNLGIKEAEGEFIAFLDSDDVWHPGKLERQLECFQRVSSDCALVYTGFLTHEGEVILPHYPEYSGWIYEDQLLDDQISPTSTVMLRRSALDSLDRWFDPELPAREDYELWLRITERFAVDYVEEPLVLLDKDSGGRISEDWKAQIQAHEILHDILEERVEETETVDVDRALASHEADLAIQLAASKEYQKAREHALTALRRDPSDAMRLVRLAVVSNFLTHKVAKAVYDSIQRHRTDIQSDVEAWLEEIELSVDSGP